MSRIGSIFPPRARLIPFVLGGPLDIGTIASLYAILRPYHPHCSRMRVLRAAIAIEWGAWRYSRALQSENP